MKQETKDLIVWIKKQINLAKECCINPAHEDGYPEYEVDYNKAMNFLDSLPEIESHLCIGGYIQDVNGIPCCDGDKVIFKYYADSITIPKTVGTLKWNNMYKRFVVTTTENNEYEFDDIYEFEKVTN